MIKPNPFAGESKDRSWFWWGINIGIFLVLVVWWWLQNKPKENGGFAIKTKPLVLPEDEPQGVPEPGVEVLLEEPETPEPKKPEDLKVVAGIGPRSAQVLGEAGIVRFEQLAGMEAEAIQAVLKAAGVRVPFPETWPEQAALAAAGDWEALDELQSSLKGGRRI